MTAACAFQVLPAEWPLRAQLLPLIETAHARLELGDRLASVTVVLDALAADDRAWFKLGGSVPPHDLILWLHPDQVLRDRPDSNAVRPESIWQLGPTPLGEAAPVPEDFSPPNAQRVLYQQLLLVRDLVAGVLRPAEIPRNLVEAFQEAWSVNLDGRLRQLRLPHLSAAERRLRFLHLFAPAGVLTPSHWAIFNRLWDLATPDQETILGWVRQLPPLTRRPRL
jgi:hypothetical protein